MLNSVLIEKSEGKIIFSGYYVDKFFFGTKEENKIEIMNDYLFYDFQIKYIINHLNKKISLEIK